jgi:hypothetical protein
MKKFGKLHGICFLLAGFATPFLKFELYPLYTEVSFFFYNEKPGIQALENKAPDLAPSTKHHPEVGRDYEYKRHGTVSLMAGIDLLNVHLHGRVVDNNYSSEFVNFLTGLD